MVTGPRTVACYQCVNRTGMGSAKWKKRRRSAAADLAVEPGAGVNPMALGGGGRDAEGLGRLAKGQGGEVAELDQPGLERVHVLELPQGLIERQQVVSRLLLRRSEGGGRVQVHAAAVAT